jgi:hypothetical protein
MRLIKWKLQRLYDNRAKRLADFHSFSPLLDVGTWFAGNLGVLHGFLSGENTVADHVLTCATDDEENLAHSFVRARRPH